GEFVGAAESDRSDVARRDRVRAGIRRAAAVLFAAGRDDVLASFARSLDALAGERFADSLSLTVLEGEWVRPPGREPQDLARPGPVE
ncbi:MAG: hypothetical protein R3F34_08145, partial [Planctomycetota bacterium]